MIQVTVAGLDHPVVKIAGQRRRRQFDAQVLGQFHGLVHVLALDRAAGTRRELALDHAEPVNLQNAAVGEPAAEGFPHLYECVQAAGDLLFVPTSWHHSAVNERLTAAVSVTIGAPLSWQEIFRRHPE